MCCLCTLYISLFKDQLKYCCYFFQNLETRYWLLKGWAKLKLASMSTKVHKVLQSEIKPEKMLTVSIAVRHLYENHYQTVSLKGCQLNVIIALFTFIFVNVNLVLHVLLIMSPLMCTH